MPQKIYKNDYPLINRDEWKGQSGQFQQAFERFAYEYGEDQGVESSSPDIASRMMRHKPRRKYDEYAKIIPCASMGQSSVVSELGRSLLPLGVYDPSQAVWQYEEKWT